MWFVTEKAVLLTEVVCLVVCSQAASQTAGDSSSAVFQREYEWAHNNKLEQYAQDSFFSLFTFTIPAHAQKVEFKVTLIKMTWDNVNRKIILSLRRAAIPVLQVYNETMPDSFILPSDQQTVHYDNNRTVSTLTLTSPTPGLVYMVASVINPLPVVIDYLRWGDKLKGHWLMDVTAMYTVRTRVTSLPIDDVSKVSSHGGQKQIYSFRISAFTMVYSVIVSNCQHNGNTTSPCNVTMMTADSLAADDKSSIIVDCRQQGPQCLLTVPSPRVQHDHYVTFSFDDSTSAQNTTFDVSFNIQGCAAEATRFSTQYWTKRPIFTQHSPKHQAGSVTPAAYRNMIGMRELMPNSVGQDPACINLGYLGRNSLPDSGESFTFSTEFGMWTSEGVVVPEFDVIAPDFSTEVRTFRLEDSVDTGGILYITAELMDSDWQGMIWVCTMPHRVAMNGSVAKCPDGALLTLNATIDTVQNQNLLSDAYLPFPSTGSWYLALQSQCWGDLGPRPCSLLPMVQLSVGITQCAPNQCGYYGDCQLYIEATTVFAACQCFAGYRGLSCEDDTYSLTDSEQLRAVYLLTLSNLAFLPAICLAVYRRYFTLAAIFFFNAFFSAFYHACDTSPVFQLCIMDYSTLAFCDFFGSILSFYAVLLTMAKINKSLQNFLLLSGALVIAVFQNSDRHSDLAHIMPLVVAGLILVVSWVREMIRRRKLYPSKHRYLCCLLPGVVLAVTGIGVNYGLMWHLSTYQYTHSFWHVSLMIAPCLLMPPRPKGLSASNKGLSISAQDIIRGGHQQSSQQPPQQEDDDEPAMFDASMNSINIDRNRLI